VLGLLKSCIYLWISLMFLILWQHILHVDLTCFYIPRALFSIILRFFRHVRIWITGFCLSGKILSFLHVLLGWENNEFSLIFVQLQHVAVHKNTYVCNKSFSWGWNIIQSITMLFLSCKAEYLTGMTMIFNVVSFNNFPN